MSISIQIQAGSDQRVWQLPSNVLFQLHKMQSEGISGDVAVIIGAPDTPLGTPRDVKRIELLNAAKSLLHNLPRLPGEFRIRFALPGTVGATHTARGLGGLLINGVHFAIMCVDDYWKIYPAAEIPPNRRSSVPPGMRGESRRSPEIFETETLGKVAIEEVKPKKSNLKRILREMITSLEEFTSDFVTVIVG